MVFAASDLTLVMATTASGRGRRRPQVSEGRTEPPGVRPVERIDQRKNGCFRPSHRLRRCIGLEMPDDEIAVRHDDRIRLPKVEAEAILGRIGLGDIICPGPHEVQVWPIVKPLKVMSCGLAGTLYDSVDRSTSYAGSPVLGALVGCCESCCRSRCGPVGWFQRPPTGIQQNVTPLTVVEALGLLLLNIIESNSGPASTTSLGPEITRHPHRRGRCDLGQAKAARQYKSGLTAATAGGQKPGR